MLFTVFGGTCAQLLLPGKASQPTLMFAGKARAYLTEETLIYSALRCVPDLTRKHWTRL
jgi:hypothetical protein